MNEGYKIIIDLFEQRSYDYAELMAEDEVLEGLKTISPKKKRGKVIGDRKI